MVHVFWSGVHILRAFGPAVGLALAQIAGVYHLCLCWQQKTTHYPSSRAVSQHGRVLTLSTGCRDIVLSSRETQVLIHSVPSSVKGFLCGDQCKCKTSHRITLKICNLTQTVSTLFRIMACLSGIDKLAFMLAVDMLTHLNLSISEYKFLVIWIIYDYAKLFC